MRAFSNYKNIVVLTGAGLSRSAGLATYRGPGGLWTDEDKANLSHIDALKTQHANVTAMFWSFREAIVKVSPTGAHRAIAAFEEALPKGASFTILTQNVDGLHQAAGSRNVCELHGNLRRWRCEECGHVTNPPDGDAPVHCGARMRPDVVLFGEMLGVATERTMKHALRDCDLFVGIGTSGTVDPAASFVRWAALNSARRVLINLEIFDDARDLYTEVHEGESDALVPNLFV
ncbi:MAG: SIR2 family NAD-dependent protein deacylase [Kofleriaceae bacterium]